jgi:hypothetical protein
MVPLGRKALPYLRGTLAFRLDTLGHNWFGVRLFHVGVIAGSTKNLTAEVALLSVYITDIGSAVGAF